MGEDWNGNEGKSSDYGDLVYPMAVGKVIKALDQKGSIGKIGDANGYYVGAAHLHFNFWNIYGQQ